jgi:enamine deaminase RidA (YjgF/YER057c/UK114 family)
MSRRNFSTNTPWEKAYGYCRAVRVGNIIEVAGTVAAGEDGQAVGVTVYEQTRFILDKIDKVLLEAGASMKDVVRTRWFLTDISTLDEAGRAHGEFFGEIRPAATAVEVSALAGKAFLIEIEASVVLDPTN